MRTVEVVRARPESERIHGKGGRPPVTRKVKSFKGGRGLRVPIGRRVVEETEAHVQIAPVERLFARLSLLVGHVVEYEDLPLPVSIESQLRPLPHPPPLLDPKPLLPDPTLISTNLYSPAGPTWPRESSGGGTLRDERRTPR